jgi:D-xylose transport system substrate-binding protein
MLSQLNNNVDAVVVGNDNLATGVIAALKSQGLNGKVPVTGQDATLVGLQQIVTGDQGMTVWKPIATEADAAAKLAAYMLDGKQAPADLLNGTIDNGSDAKVPAVLLEPVSVTKSNLLDTVVKGGVATKDEICQGLPQPCLQ